jgi:hypothetical protein
MKPRTMVLHTLVVGIVFGALAAAGMPAQAGSDPEALCESAKAKASGKKAADLLKAFGKNAKTADVAKLAAGISKAQSKFTKAFLKEDSKGGCSATGDAEAIESTVDSFVAQVFELLTPTTSTLATTTTTTTVQSNTTTTTTLPSCDAGAWPTCNGACPESASCGLTDPAGDCRCVPSGTIPCGESTGPECDGSCPEGLACGEPAAGAGCRCIVSPGSCGAAGAPECGGECPSWAPYCVENGVGGCLCAEALYCDGTMPFCEDPGPCTNAGLTCDPYGYSCQCLGSCGEYPACTGECAPTVGQVCSSHVMTGRCVCVTAPVGCNGESNPDRCELDYQDACPPNSKCYFSPVTGGCACRII